MKKISISIIIATCNREALLWISVEEAIKAIEGRPVEIIIVNDGDEPLNPKLQDKIKLFDNPGKGVSAARNYGAAKSAGDILFFVDDDMWINKEAIDWILSYAINTRIRDVVYNLNWEYPPSLNDKLTATKVGRYLLSSHYNTLWGRMHQQGEAPLKGLYKFEHIASCSLIMHKDVFNRLGGYNESLIFQGEDIDLSRRLNMLSVSIYVVFDITLYHNHQDRLELEGFLKRLNNGYASEFKAVKQGIIPGKNSYDYAGFKKIILESIRLSESFWILLHKALPNKTNFRFLNNKLVGTLAGLQRYKQWRTSRTG